MAYFPVFIDTSDKRVLVIGGGHVGLEKTTGLINADTPQITVISPDLLPELEQWRREGRIQHLARPYQDGDMVGYDWVMVATDDGAANAEIRREGQRRAIWVNAADDPVNCDFILPSVVRKGTMTIAISTGGGSPAMARRVREELTDYFTEDFEALAELLAEVRRELKQHGVLRDIPQQTWQDAIDGPLRALLAQRRWGQAKARLYSRLGPNVLPLEPPLPRPAAQPEPAEAAI
ncbi:MAG TPA: bifunctional precorrin-2 dehydrogenase/sirohydrochlorin ferrochelatase [Dehalococcoidia bacterium]|nr:bifunctional precorrin-2 dehydrogenase/sirohydrochlorin ferrochelatase [Dehalococcoidia bacterium]